jgi:hypothetical protein
MLHDSIIVFTSDNGGPANGFNLNYASNWPLRGVMIILIQDSTYVRSDNLLSSYVQKPP